MALMLWVGCPSQALAQQTGPDTSSTREPLPYPLKPDDHQGNQHSMDLDRPDVMQEEYEYDPETDSYRIKRNLGDDIDLDEEEVPLDEYIEQREQEQKRDYFRERSRSQNFTQGDRLIPQLDLGSPLLEDIFGGDFVDIKPQGSAELTIGGDNNVTLNPAWSQQQQRNFQFKFDQQINLDVTGKIGEAVTMRINYNTETNFNFDNEVKLGYQGDEDKILQSIEVGNVSMPLNGQLIQGSQNLFGVKSKLRFGRLDVTMLYSQQRSERQTTTLENGAVRQEFNISADNYDENRHFFLAQYFRDNYERFLRELPVVRSPVIINRVDVYVTNTVNNPQNTRNILAFADLGEPTPNPNQNFVQPRGGGEPDNNANTLFDFLTSNPDFRSSAQAVQALEQISQTNDFQKGRDYQKITNARQLQPSEYTINEKLGYISLNQQLNNDEVLAVAFEYTVNGRQYQVGEFARDVSNDPNDPNVIYLKMLKGVSPFVDQPIWDLMMKNIYALPGAFQLQEENFLMNIIYADDESNADLNYIPEESLRNEQGKNVALLQELRLDQINLNQERGADGLFDFIPGVTVDKNKGRIIFPVLEPFDDALTRLALNGNEQLEDKYAYPQLYDSIQFTAQQAAEKNKFFLRGEFQGSSGAVIPLNGINVEEGSVTVTANGRELQENIDYTVDYTLGRVRIINESLLESGADIQVSSENSNFFNPQQKTLFGTRLDYTFNEDARLGATFMHLRERPLTQKVNVGNEPISNSILGVDGSYATESRFLTTMVDGIPGLDTKAPSRVQVTGEFAQIFPGSPNVIGEGGIAYLDDFEGSVVPYDLSIPQQWKLASTPQGQPNLFKNNFSPGNRRGINDGRARLAWYTIDPIFFQPSNLTPANVRGNPRILSNHYQRQITAGQNGEIFKNRQFNNQLASQVPTFDLAFFPREPGPYNYNVDDLQENGQLTNPETNWGGITRPIERNNFEAANVEYIQIWMLDPFLYDSSGANTGKLYINLGNISEDVLRDNLRAYENGLPEDGNLNDPLLEATEFGYVSRRIQTVDAFSNDPDARQFQDVGLDGVSAEDEQNYFQDDFLQQIEARFGTGSRAYQLAEADPSRDNFRFYRQDDYLVENPDIIERYKYFNGQDGNSPVATGDITRASTLQPDNEDINGDFTLNELEGYFQYEIDISKDALESGGNFVTNRVQSNVRLPNGNTEQVTWYQMQIPVRQFTERIGNISDFKSIRFMRMFLTGFTDSIILRMASLELVRSDWRRYQESLNSPSLVEPVDTGSNTRFDIASVNIEENSGEGDRGIPYVVPPQIERTLTQAGQRIIQNNEQSLSLRVENLEDGDARGAFKSTEFDIRRYNTLELFAHMEGPPDLEDDDLDLFIRIGTDYQNNYYEYQLPLKKTPDNSQSADLIWPDSNQVQVALSEFFDLKAERIAQGGPVSQPFERRLDNGHLVRVVGNPDLSNLRALMVGVRNPAFFDNPRPDDGMPKTATIWVNELRVTGFDEEGGWAALANVKADLADFGQVNLAGNRTTIGFGQVEQSLNERSLEDERGYDFSTQLSLGDFFGKQAGVNLPMFYSYGQTFIRPKFDPLNPDINLQQILDQTPNEARRDEILERSQDVTTREALNFTNVRIASQRQGNPRIYDPQNFNLTYSYQRTSRRNTQFVFDDLINRRVSLGYNYNFVDSEVRPFKKLKPKSLKIIKDFNFYYLPQSYGMSGTLNRRFNQKLFRNNSGFETPLDTLYNKRLTFKRDYNLNYNLTQSLRLTYTATANSIIDEPPGPIDTGEERDSVWQNLQGLGRLSNYQQNTNVNYNTPINKLPGLDWVNANTSYSGSYNWQTAPPAAEELGNSITNSNTITLNGQGNLVSFYNKSKFLRTVNQNKTNIPRLKKEKAQRLRKERQQQRKEAQEEGEDKKDQEQPGGPIEAEVNEPLIKTAEAGSRVLMALRNVSANYSIKRSTSLPGFTPTPNRLGNDFTQDAPGTGYVFGLEDDILDRSIENRWLSDSSFNEFQRSEGTNLNLRATIEPIRDLRIDLDWRKQENENFSTRLQQNVFGEYERLAPVTSGNYSISFNSWPTAFASADDEGLTQFFDDFEANRRPIAERLGGDNPTDPATGYPRGYDSTAQDVLIPAFIAAYTGQDAEEVDLSPFPSIPQPNWRISYRGLGRMDFLKDLVRSVTINHSYRSNYSVGQYITALDPERNLDSIPAGQNLEPELQIRSVSITEQFSPLAGVDISWQNSWTTRLEYRRSRTLNFNIDNTTLNKTRSNEFVIGAGYRTNEFVLPFRVNRRQVVLKNDLNFRFDFKIRDNVTSIKRLDEAEGNATTGSTVISIQPNVQYTLSKNLTLTAFYDRQVTRPRVANSYVTKFTSFGFRLRYVLAP